MLNGIDPILIFTFSTDIRASLTASVAKIPVVSNVINKLGFPPIPIYLSEALTGLYIDSENKNIDIETTPETLTNGITPVVNQKGINSTIKVNMVATKGSIGLILLSTLCDLIFTKVTSKDYKMTYVHGATTIFNGLLHTFSVNQVANTDLYTIDLEIVFAEQAKGQLEVGRSLNPTRLAPTTGPVPH